MTKRKSTTVKSTHVRFDNRTYFFNINQAESKKKYLKITESKFMGEGKDRIYNSFILFPSDVSDFKKQLEESAGFLG